jgi:hypothetical protein
MGILILFFLAVGTGTTVYYVGKGVVILYRKLHPHDVKAVTGITELQIALNQMAIEPLPNDRPRNPAYASLASLEIKVLIVKRIEEIETMPAWDRHVMDLKDGLLSVRESVMKQSAFSRFSFYFFVALMGMYCVAKPGLLIFIAPIFLYLYVFGPQKGTAAERWSFKNYFSKLSPEQMRQVYADVADSNARVEEMRTAFQSSGLRVRRW